MYSKIAIAIIYLFQILPLKVLAEDSELTAALSAGCTNPEVYTIFTDTDGKSTQTIQIEDETGTATFNCAGVGVTPPELAMKECEPEGQVDRLKGDLEEIQMHAQCGQENQNDEAACMKQMGCSLFQTETLNSVMPSIGAALDKAKPDYCKKAPKFESDCLKSMMKGTVAGINGLIKSFVDMAGAGVEWGKEKLRGVFGNKEFLEADAKQAELLAALRNMPDEVINGLKEDPAGFVAKLAKQAMDDFINTVKAAATCKEWQGDPLSSECKEPLPAWSCLGCSDKANVVCASYGYLGEKAIETIVMVALSAFGVGAGVAAIKGSVWAAKLGKHVGAIGAKTTKIAKAALKASADKAGVVAKAAGQAGKVVKATVKVPMKVAEIAQKAPGLKQWISLNEKVSQKAMEAGAKSVSPKAANISGALNAPPVPIENMPEDAFSRKQREIAAYEARGVHPKLGEKMNYQVNNEFETAKVDGKVNGVVGDNRFDRLVDAGTTKQGLDIQMKERQLREDYASANADGNQIGLSRDVLFNKKTDVLLHEYKHASSSNLPPDGRQIQFTKPKKGPKESAYDSGYRFDELEARIPEMAELRKARKVTEHGETLKAFEGFLKDQKKVVAEYKKDLNQFSIRTAKFSNTPDREYIHVTNPRTGEVMSVPKKTPVEQAQRELRSRIDDAINAGDKDQWKELNDLRSHVDNGRIEGRDFVVTDPVTKKDHRFQLKTDRGQVVDMLNDREKSLLHAEGRLEKEASYDWIKKKFKEKPNLISSEDKKYFSRTARVWDPDLQGVSLTKPPETMVSVDVTRNGVTSQEVMSMADVERLTMTDKTVSKIELDSVVAPKPKQAPETSSAVDNFLHARKKFVDGGGKSADVSVKRNMLHQAADLSKEDRTRAAEVVLGVKEPLGDIKANAINEAHLVGSSEGRGFKGDGSDYTTEQLREKAKILRDAGFLRHEIDQLMRSGITGSLADDVGARTREMFRFVDKADHGIVEDYLGKLRNSPANRNLTQDQQAKLADTERNLVQALKGSSNKEKDYSDRWRVVASTLGSNGVSVKEVKSISLKGARLLDAELKGAPGKKPPMMNDDRALKAANTYKQAGETEKAANMLAQMKDKEALNRYVKDIANTYTKGNPYQTYLLRQDLEMVQHLIDKKVINIEGTGLKEGLTNRLEKMRKAGEGSAD